VSDRDDQIEMLRAEIAELRQRLEINRAAFAEGIGQQSEELAACVKAMVRDLENGLFKLVDQRFAALTARLDLFLPDKPRANDADERDDDVEKLPKLRRTH
jgi:hypothetical protein